MTTTTHAAGFTKRNKSRRVSPRPNPYAAYQVIKAAGQRAVLINAAKTPKFDITTHACRKCSIKEYISGQMMPVAYAHKYTKTKHCDECCGDEIAVRGMALERDLGIKLGWGCDEHSKEYEREAHVYTSTRTRLQHDAKEV